MNINCIFNCLLHTKNLNILLTCKTFNNLSNEYLYKRLLNNVCITTKNKCSYYDLYKAHHQIMKSINKKLTDLFGDADKFKQTMKQTNAIISGSFLIQSILNEKYDGDFDIFIPLTPNNEHFMYQHNTFPFSLREQQYMGEYNMKLIDNIVCFIKNNQKVEFIYLNTNNNVSSLYNFINTYFDFNICKNMYHYDGTDNIFINNLDAILSKQATITTQFNVNSIVSRYHKYTNRGFNFTNKNQLSYKDFPYKTESYEIIKVDPSYNHYIYYINDKYRTTIEKLINTQFITRLHEDKITFKKSYMTPCTNSCHVKLFNPILKHFHYMHYIVIVKNI